MGRKTLIVSGVYGSIIIGKNALLSDEIVIQAGDGHTIFDVTTGENINSNRKKIKGSRLYEVEVGDHVWIGRRTFILGGHTYIGSGSIVGAMSFVKGRYPNNVTIAGVPARVVRKDVAWCDENCAEDIALCKEYYQETKGV